MNKDIMRKAGFSKEVDMIEEGVCPDCGKKIEYEDFRNELSIKEFNISGMCQKCQDDFFGED